MSSYSTDALQKLNDAFWRSNNLWELEQSRLPCPECGALAHIVFVGGTFGSPAEIHAICYSCKREGSVRAVEEESGSFEPEEAEKYVKRHQMGLVANCHYRQTVLSVQEHGSFEGMAYFILCPRCGADGQIEA